MKQKPFDNIIGQSLSQFLLLLFYESSDRYKKKKGIDVKYDSQRLKFF